jgi:hypothetical protein
MPLTRCFLCRVLTCYTGGLSKKMKNESSATAILQSGQVWQMEDSNLQIDLVGRTLVHYKHFKGQLKRAPVSLASKKQLGKFLRQNKAVLLSE